MNPAVLPADKYLLTVNEAATYFNVGVKRLVNLLETPEGADLMIQVGVKRLVNRPKMEKYLDHISSL
ncbi:MAG: transposase [Schwartzia sp.]|nr:transposase [Schwartzia sp. (in: firmicutes)]